ncbi:outer membrane beta-barrel protein [Niabella sp. CJ426]|uniref:outer membrane beta-barrel protein n=1 Tax=Niabella sp. CJ426 TaxID=3393740 RepID=UPI003D081DE3
MRLYFTLLILLVSAIGSYSQTSVLKGTLVDSSENKSLQNTVVTLFKSKDSTLMSYTRAGARGEFQLNVPDTGSYILLITHPYFADFSDKIIMKPGEPVNVGIINMISKSKLLEEVVVKTGSPIRIKGDTTIYTADSFKVREGGTVEELLKKLPGVQVDRNGQITALGEKVERFLVDGEEFFGSDPGIATKNLRADIVKDVQVYKGKSDQAAFTGIDDGQSKQTMNLVLKEDKKKGYFAKIEAGGGLKNGNNLGEGDKFNNALMFNAFKAKRKISAYGIMSNTGKLNLDWDDRSKYGGGSDVQTSDDGGIFISSMGGDYNRSDGIPTNWNGGIHYNNKFNNDKQSINAGYRITKINAPGETKSYSRNFLPDSTWLNYNNNSGFSSNLKQGANLIFETKIDSMNTLKLTAQGNFNNMDASYNYYSENRNVDSSFINVNNRHGQNKTDNSNIGANLLWMHKFKKLYRTISVNGGFNHTEAKGTALLYSNIDFYRNGVVDSTGELDQNTISDNVLNNINTRIAYTEPLLKDFYLELSYAFGLTKNANNRNVFFNDGTGRYNQFIDSLSNDFQFNTLSNAPGINFRYNKKKLNFSLGTSAAFTNLDQRDLTNGTTRGYNFVNHSPRANLSYKIKPSETLSFYYNGAGRAPSLNQLQPIPDNSDPLNIRVGNPLLKPSFSHDFDLYYNSFKTLKERGIWASASYNLRQNAFTQFSEFADGIRKYYDVNTNGVASFNSNFNYNFKWKGPGIRVGAGVGYGFNRNVDFVSSFSTNNGNSAKNITKTNTYSFSIDVYKSVDEKYDFGLAPNARYNNTRATVSSNANADYWSGGLNIWGNVQLPGKIEIRTDVDANYVQKDPRFPANNNYVIWNGFVTKKFYKNQFEARLSIYDILNQNRGYNRNFGNYSFAETYRTTLQRFWLVSFVWNITKNGTPAPAAK